MWEALSGHCQGNTSMVKECMHTCVEWWDRWMNNVLMVLGTQQEDSGTNRICGKYSLPSHN